MQPPWLVDPVLDRGGHDLPFDDYEAIVREALARTIVPWNVSADAAFVTAEPWGQDCPPQGWKLHLSATVLSASSVLRVALPILISSRTAFKACRAPRVLASFTAANAPLDAAGKFLTIYPANDTVAVSLADRLIDATAGLTGPRVHTDRPLAPDSIVTARYGAFDREQRVFDHLATLVGALKRPDGALVPDERQPGRYAPVWVTDPFAPISNGTGPLPSVVLGETTLLSTIKRGNGGGIYRGTRDGRGVVAKEARPHVSVDRFGRDLRDRRRHEHAVLTRLGAIGVAPQPIELIERDSHVFLVMEDLGRTGLRSAAAARQGARDWQRATAQALAEAVARCHGAGVIVRDVHPGNVMLDGAGVPRLIDLELAWIEHCGEPWFSGATLAYASPAAERYERPTRADDVYALGATLFALVTGVDPLFLPDEERNTAQKAADLLTWADVDSWARHLIPACLSSDPADRPTLADIQRALETPPVIQLGQTKAQQEDRTGRVDRAISGLADYLRASFGTYANGGLWPVTRLGWLNDPHCAATGTAGVGMALCALQRAGYEVRDQIEAAASAATGARVAPGRPIGLCTGDAGIACFLAHASDVLGDPRLVDDAMSLLGRSALDTDRMDLADGVAGVLQVAAAIYRWTGDAVLGSLAEACVERLLASRTETSFGIGWILPASRTPDGREKVYPGYATGSTGIAVTLLAAGVWFERDEWRDAGVAVLDDLLAHAGPGDALVWPASNHASKPSAFWEKGIAGIGAGFARAALLTGNRVYRDVAIGCARRITPVRPGSLVTLFHGLAGIGELLLDLELFFADKRYRAELDQIVDLVLDQAIDYRGHGWGICFPDEDGLAAADLGLGSAGIAAWLIRYRDGGPRVLYADEGMDLGRFGVDNAQ